MLTVTVMVEVLIKHVYSAFAAAFFSLAYSGDSLALQLLYTTDQSETHKIYDNSKLCCVYCQFLVYIINMSLCHIRPVAMLYRPCGK